MTDAIRMPFVTQISAPMTGNRIYNADYTLPMIRIAFSSHVLVLLSAASPFRAAKKPNCFN